MKFKDVPVGNFFKIPQSVGNTCNYYLRVHRAPRAKHNAVNLNLFILSTIDDDVHVESVVGEERKDLFAYLNQHLTVYTNLPTDIPPVL